MTQKKTVLITGGTSGIGFELVAKLSAAGYSVIACGRSQATLDAANRQIPKARFVQADITTHEGRGRIVSLAKEQGASILINNAGIQNAITIGSGKSKAIAEEIEVNLTAQMILTDMMIPVLRAQKDPKIVNILSALALAPKKSAPVYCAAKAGFMVFTRSLRDQLNNSGISVMAVYPPLVDTQMTKGNTATDKISPSDCADEIVTGIENNARDLYIGKAKLLKVLHSVFPPLAYKIMRDN